MARDGASKAPVKLSSVVDASRYVNASTAATLTVAVRARPLVRAEIAKGGRRDIIRVMDGRVVLVLDPDDSKDYLDQVQNRTKEKRYTFDIAFGSNATNRDVYNGTVRDLLGGVLQGMNTTVFAYGATGSGKTYTMVGSPHDPGLMVLCLDQIFADRDAHHRDEDFSVTCSYLEVYNEIIYDLLVKNSSPLELREDPELGVVVAGLKHITVTSAAEIMSLLEEGNRRRKTEATDANASSSRSHAVLEITVRRTPKNHYKVTQLRGKLSLVDLAGSERAAETNNAGQKLRDGANINRSLLALANCINALGKANAGKAAAYVPYRNSKLTRLLKDGLSGNSRTAMVATVSGSSDQYHHSINTLKYADRAKEIKTHVVQNVGTVESHVADYQRIIDNLQSEVQDLRGQLVEREAATARAPPGSSKPASSEEALLVLIGKLVEEMNDNIEERINLQKALFEIEDANLYNKHELSQLDEFLEAGKGNAKDITEARERRAEVLEATRENDRERERYKSEIAANEVARKDIQARVQAIVDSNQSAAFLNLLSTFRLQALHLQELKFQMAVRDQIIGEQRQVIGNLWKIVDKSGLPRERVMEIAKAEGIIMDGLQFGGGGGPPTVGPVPMAEALKAVKQEMGLTDLRITPEIGNRRGTDRQLRYRAWPASSAAVSASGGHYDGPGSAGAAAAGGAQRSASADASPYASGEEGDDSEDDDHKSVRSDKSPLRMRAGPGGHHHKHHPHVHAHQPSSKGGGAGEKKRQGGNAAAAAVAAAAAARANGAAAAPRRSRIPGAGGAPAARQIDLADAAFAPQPPASSLSGAAAPSRPVERIKSGRRAGQHKAALPAGDLAELPAVMAGLAIEPVGLPPRAGGRLSDAGGGGAGLALGAARRAGAGVASAGMDFEGVQLEGRGYGRRRHTVAHGGGHESGGPDTSDEAPEFSGPQRVASDVGRSEAAMPAPPPQPPLNERLARFKGRLSNAAAIAAAPLPGDLPMGHPPPVVAGVGISAGRR
ncbi:hypothetical protein HYH02_014133 [Chlamydomonas schloesseri]|uniref:Kinesin-like protein KIN-8B n=1 Tax=Chlamydomonas schloesseri TaxID=2026947 RepID=A0A835T0C0_9CHLO|nr:hypothetical protein HYH02_014133 [Chlamydomonas schloesseri]|eukprot:KAG2429201.1 hypothetical protein HYH02_014133 [Chlamydomonas schloesseri]